LMVFSLSSAGELDFGRVLMVVIMLHFHFFV
jgi:hypothetical protein